jgi:sterol 3beta-glucosyltransferase
MQITILATGSRGDIQPYIALGQALVKRGHAVRIATFELYASFIRENGLEVFPIRGDLRQVMNGELAQMQADNPLKIFLSFNKLKSYVYVLQQDFYAACQQADAVIYHPGAAIGYFAARQRGVPSILATPFPMTPTRAYPSLIFYDQPRLGGQVNWLSHKLFEQIMWMASSGPVKQFWQAEFGRAPADFGSPFARQAAPDCPTVVGCSPQVFPRPADWPEHVVETGYWFLDEEQGWTPPPGLLAFLQSGPAPVYVGFGSVGAAQAGQTTRVVLEALRRAGQRGILASGWGGLAQAEPLPEDVYLLESAPHAWLFPRMAAVVHHGGAGTTAAGFRAGVPSAIVPFANDQFAWGRRAYELGVGARPLPRKRLSAEGLAAAIQAALSAEVKAAAQALGEKIRAEQGAELAAEVICRCLSS